MRLLKALLRLLVPSLPRPRSEGIVREVRACPESTRLAHRRRIATHRTSGQGQEGLRAFLRSVSGLSGGIEILRNARRVRAWADRAIASFVPFIARANAALRVSGSTKATARSPAREFHPPPSHSWTKRFVRDLFFGSAFP